MSAIGTPKRDCEKIDSVGSEGSAATAWSYFSAPPLRQPLRCQPSRTHCRPQARARGRAFDDEVGACADQRADAAELRHVRQRDHQLAERDADGARPGDQQRNHERCERKGETAQGQLGRSNRAPAPSPAPTLDLERGWHSPLPFLSPTMGVLFRKLLQKQTGRAIRMIAAVGVDGRPSTRWKNESSAPVCDIPSAMPNNTAWQPEVRSCWRRRGSGRGSARVPITVRMELLEKPSSASGRSST